MTCNAGKELENHLPKYKKDFELRTFEDHSSISSCDGEHELELTKKFKKLMKQKLKNKKNVTTYFKCKKKNINWDESSSSKEKINKGEVANYALIAFNDEVIETPLIYFEIT